jgi:ribosomal protection tetracycline resistance protein
VSSSRTPLTLGILAHVDAGKTSLTERLLLESGALATAGSVDAGTTRTDSLALERRRGITIRASVTAFVAGGVTVTVVDTPGHPDFVAEVERSLAVLDAAVLVVSAVEGVQPQTVVLRRALERLGVPTLVFVNKCDRAGSDADTAVVSVRRRLGARAVLLARARDEGGPSVSVETLPPTAPEALEVLADHDDEVLEALVEDRPVPPSLAWRALAGATRGGGVVPVVCGSAVTGAGVGLLRDLLVRLLAAPRAGTPPACNEQPAGTVFAVDRDAHGRRAWVRLWSGTLHVRDRLVLGGREPRPVTDLVVAGPSGEVRTREVSAGQVAALRGPDARVGDVLGRPPARRVTAFAPPSLRALVEPVCQGQRTALFAALEELAEEDPLIDLRLEPEAGEASVSVHGEVQQEVLEAWLLERFGIPARFLATTVVCLERVVGRGEDRVVIEDPTCPYLAGLGLRVDTAPPGSGVQVRHGVEPGRLVPAFVAAAEEGVRRGLEQGLQGWQVTDCVVTMTSSGYYPRQSRPHQRFDKASSTIATDVRNLAPVVLQSALARAGTRVCEPVDRFDAEVPEPAVGPLADVVGRLGGVLLETRVGDGYARLAGHLPAARAAEVSIRLPDLTGGEWVWTARPDHHRPVTGPPPERRRRGPDPLDREAWYRAHPR